MKFSYFSLARLSVAKMQKTKSFNLSKFQNFIVRVFTMKRIAAIFPSMIHLMLGLTPSNARATPRIPASLCEPSIDLLAVKSRDLDQKTKRKNHDENHQKSPPSSTTLPINQMQVFFGFPTNPLHAFDSFFIQHKQRRILVRSI